MRQCTLMDVLLYYHILHVVIVLPVIGLSSVVLATLIG